MVAWFNVSYMAVILMKKPKQAIDLLAYCSLIIRASIQIMKERHSWVTVAEPTRFSSRGKLDTASVSPHL